MSQTKYPVLKIRNKNPESISTGANTEVTLDGKKLPYLSFLKLEFHSRKVTKVTMEMFVDIDIEIEAGDASMTIKKVSGLQSILGQLHKHFFNK